MALSEKKVKEMRKSEMSISTNLFIISSLVTIATMVLMVIDFFSRGSFLPTKIGFFYLIVVLIYSLHKEFVRWLGEKKIKRNGEYFVYAWIILTTALYVINFLSRNYYDFSEEGYPIKTLADIAYTTIEVLGIFIVTRIMKVLFALRK